MIHALLPLQTTAGHATYAVVHVDSATRDRAVRCMQIAATWCPDAPMEFTFDPAKIEWLSAARATQRYGRSALVSGTVHFIPPLPFWDDYTLPARRQLRVHHVRMLVTAHAVWWQGVFRCAHTHVETARVERNWLAHADLTLI